MGFSLKFQRTYDDNVELSDPRYCEELGAKCDANKGVRFKALPDVLTLHLMRFQFDFNLLRRRKVM